MAEAHASLAAEARSVSVARRLLAQLLDACDVRSNHRSDALLVASELVAWLRAASEAIVAAAEAALAAVAVGAPATVPATTMPSPARAALTFCK